MKIGLSGKKCLKRKYSTGRLAGLVPILTAVCLSAFLPGTAEESRQLTGYFDTPKIVRPDTVRAGDSLALLPAYEPLEMTWVSPDWGRILLEDGRTGYVYTPGLLPLPEIVPVPDKMLFSEQELNVLNFPDPAAPVQTVLAPRTLVFEDGECGGYARIRVGEKSGFVPAGSLTEPVLPALGDTPDTRAAAGEETALYTLPLENAPLAGSLPAGSLFPAFRKTAGNFLPVLFEGQILFARAEEMRLAEWDPETALPGLLDPMGGNGPDADQRGVFLEALVKEDGTAVSGPDGGKAQLNAGDKVFVYTCYGPLAVVTGAAEGYVPMESLSLITPDEKARRIGASGLSGATIGKCDCLDQAFSLLEEGNSLVLRYNAVTGSQINSLFPQGAPYFWGGKSYNVMVERYPDYTTRLAWQSSRVYYKKDLPYLSGFDCTGMVKAVRSLMKRPLTESFDTLMWSYYCNAGNHVFCSDQHPWPEDMSIAAGQLLPGDILVFHHPGRHAMIFIGTLRQYGYTGEQLPSLAEYLDYPLFIQSGEDPLCYYRFRAMIACSDDERIARAVPPDGGASLTILGVPQEKADRVYGAHGTLYFCFDLEGTCLNITDLSTMTDYYVYRD